MSKIYFTDTAVMGRFRLEKMKSGKQGRRLKLCNLADYEFKITKSGRKVSRNTREKEIFLDHLYHTKLRELTALREIQEEEPPPDSEWIRIVMKAWLEHVKAYGDKGSRTHADYKRTAVYYLDSVKDHPINDFKKEYNNDFINFLTERGLARNTIHKHFRNLQTFFYWAEENEYCRLIRLKKPKKTKKEPKTLSRSQLQDIQKRLQEKHLGARNRLFRLGYQNMIRAFYMMCETAMRGGEVWSLRLSEIDLHNRQLYIVDNEKLEWFVKGQHEETIPISNNLAAFLETDLKDRKPEEVWYLDDGSGSQFYQNLTTLGRPIRKILQEMDISGVKPLQGIRASVVTNLLADGFSLSWVQKLARHKDLETTRGYQNSLKIDIVEMVNRISGDG
ncbi:tyrosine-type recombinase/integrase [bacterium]|nr:tyrosine-type recombinase/integrase [bacterium]